MTEQDINKIKALFPEGEVKCTLTENGIVIEHKLEKILKYYDLKLIKTY